MSYDCKILADATSPAGDRLTTFQITFPRFILAELNTHRALSRNSASSRAIPVAKAIKAVEDSPFIPEEFGANVPGMLWKETLEGEKDLAARRAWRYAIDQAVWVARKLDEGDVHKALANRVLEPYQWHTAIITATDWENFWALRIDENAQPEFRKIAEMMRDAYETQSPWVAQPGEWSLPLVDESEMIGDGEGIVTIDWDYWKKISAGRCARVSYLTHDGVRDPQKDIELAESLMANGHMSPLEHQATPFTEYERDYIAEIQDQIEHDGQCNFITQQLYNQIEHGIQYDQNLKGWHSYRSFIPNQDNFGRIKDALH